MSKTSARCPIRDGEPCSLCVPGVEGPHECGLVWMIMQDDELRAEWDRRRREQREQRNQRRAAAQRTKQDVPPATGETPRAGG